METADCLKEQNWLCSVSSLYSVHSARKLYRMAEKRRCRNMEKAKVRSTKGLWLQKLSRKTPMTRKIMSRER